jgi:hypothetical protein
MKALVQKEFRENLRLAVLGLVIYALLLFVQYRGYIESPSNMSQPLAERDLMWSTAWFCGIFGAVLGWLQIHNERRPDLWAFLMHRPVTRTEIFLGKTLAGLGLYAVVVGVPLLSFIAWARWPRHVAAPFEPAMLQPVAAYVLAGILPYFAGMLTGLRQARWYASRALGLGLAIIVPFLVLLSPELWQGLLVILVGTAILASAAWGGFQSHGYYRSQPAWGKASLTAALLPACGFIAAVAALLLSNLFPTVEDQQKWSQYVVTKDGVIFKMNRGPGRSWEIVDLEGKPVHHPKTGRMTELSDFERQRARESSIDVPGDNYRWPEQWMGADLNLAPGWRATSDTLWYYWRRYGRLVGYDIKTRQCVGSLGPQGSARDLVGGGDRFGGSSGRRESRTLRTATTIYEADLEKREVKPLFTTTSDDPILGTSEIGLHDYDWQYTAVVTKRFVYLLTAEGQTVWKVAYEPKGAGYTEFGIYLLEPPGQFVLWRAPSYQASVQAGWSLPIYVSWLARDQGVVKSAELAALPIQEPGPGPGEKLLAAAMPPTLVVMLPHFWVSWWARVLPMELLPLSLAGAVLVCVPIGWWLGRRYRFSFAAQAGWAVFHVVFGVPGLLAFLSVQEWPAREACPNCKRLRLVDRTQCEHCGADFAPPEKTGTEVFVALGAKVEVPAGG